MNYSTVLKGELEGLLSSELSRVSRINRYYDIYQGKQGWSVNSDLAYRPAQKITNWTRKLINKKARFMFGIEPYFNFQSVEGGASEDEATVKERLLKDILDSNKWHAKLLKARKDCSIGGKIAIRLWADKNEGLRLFFSPAQEFIDIYDLDDTDSLKRVVFFYSLNDDMDKSKQRIKKQVWFLEDGKCYVDERTFDGYGKVLSVEFDNYFNGLDFIPVVVIRNGGLTGELSGESDVDILWSNQDAYNRLSSDDLDALKFQMFGQDVFTDVSEASLDNLVIAPGAMIDLRTDPSTPLERCANVSRLESSFSYSSKYEQSLNEIKNAMYELLDVPNTSLSELKGMMASGKSMKAAFWDLMAVCDEDWTEWEPALKSLVEYIFRIVAFYNLYDSKSIAEYNTILTIERQYPIQEDSIEDRKMDLEEVISQVRSKYSYIKKWSEIDDTDSEIERILEDNGDVYDLPDDKEV